MNFKNFKWSSFISSSISVLLYPLVKMLISESKKLRVFCDTLCIMSLFLILAGILYSFYLHGDFDTTSYILKRSVKIKTKEYDAYMKDASIKGKKGFNYPLFAGFFWLFIAISATYLFIGQP